MDAPPAFGVRHTEPRVTWFAKKGEGVRHWAGPFENADLLLQPGWSHRPESPAPGDCG